jgi:hypothetical protein
MWRAQPQRPGAHFSADFSRTPEDEAFITGNGIAGRCRHVLNYGQLIVNEDVDNDWWFCKADYLEYFFRELAPRDEFVLFSHNSDRAIGRRFARELRRRRLVAWFAQNAVLRHPKLRALPIGIANPRWPHGDQAVFNRVQSEARAKLRLFDASFALATNPGERGAAVEGTGITPTPSRPFPDYLAGLAESYFCISPSGNGVDSHRTWEALYLGAIPIVTRSVLTEHHVDIPMVVLDDWSAFRTIDFSSDLYAQIWGEWDAAELRLDRYLARVEQLIAELRG